LVFKDSFITSLVIVFGSSLGDAAHHFEELFKVDLSIAVLVNLSNSLLQLCCRVDILEFFTFEELLNLTRIDLTTVVRVKHLKCGL